jgi:CheY-like chemotaxis protein
MSEQEQSGQAAPAAGGPTVLVVDDSPFDRRLVGAVLERDVGGPVHYADSGAEALDLVGRVAPQVILTDLQMPGMNGLELVETLRTRYPRVPVVLMTAYGNEDIALSALHAGAASYVPKRNIGRDLALTLDRVLAAARRENQQRQVLERLDRGELAFVLENDSALVLALVGQVQEYLGRLRLCDEADHTRVGIALGEALHNALYHGNLELDSALREQDEGLFRRLAEERAAAPPYRDRKVRATIRLSRSEAVFVVTDEGPGFNPTAVPDPTDPANLEKTSGRGLLLMRMFMDEVGFSARGNEVTMVKRCSSRGKCS